ncbi:hypothetical protein BSKO_11444 [Bryopsis sp. KO-2023]|nr:hypothetical protein BSKO_11444 [Bryopsis sp. KO-2023]
MVEKDEGLSEDSPRFDPFRRSDRYGREGKAPQPPAEMARRWLFTIFVFPLRSLCVILTVLSCYLVCCIGTLLPKSQANAFVATVGRILSRTCLLACGFFWIDWREVEDAQKDEKFCTIVSNHVSWVDILMHMSRSFPSFVAKDATKAIPMVGLISQMLGCIYVKRENKVKGEVGVAGQVKQRMLETYESGSPYGRMLLFPEGTTTNGNYLLPFKTGAFLAGVPVQPTIIKYTSKWMSPAWETIGGMDHVFLLLTSPWHSVTIFVLPVYVPSEEEKKDPQLFANNVRDYMLKFSQLKSSDSGLSDKKVYHAMIKNHKPAS